LGRIAENELLQLELNVLRADAAVEMADLDYQNMLFTFKSYLRIQSNNPIVLVPPANTEYFTVDVNEALAKPNPTPLPAWHSTGVCSKPKAR
jgi:hypothetical protein